MGNKDARLTYQISVINTCLIKLIYMDKKLD